MRKKSLGKNLFFNLSYNFLKMIFPLITFPYATRVLGAEGIGKINFSTSIVGYFALIASLGISTYAIREGVSLRDNRKKLSDFVSGIFSINCISTVVSLILLACSLLCIPSLLKYKTLIFIYSTTIIAAWIGVDWINNIFEDFTYITVRNLAFQILSILALFLFVRDKSDYVIYIIIYAFSSIGTNILNFFHIRKYVDLKIKFGFQLKKHLKPIMILFGSSIATSVYMNLDTVMLGFLQNEVSVGLYSAAVKINRILLNLIVAVNAVLLPRISRNIYENNNEKNHCFLMGINISIIVPMGLGIMSISRYVIELLCGIEFMAAVPAMQILSASFVFSALNNCIANQILIPNGAEKFNLISTLIGASFNFAANIIFIPILAQNGAAITTLLSELLVFIIFAVYCSKHGMSFFLKKRLKYLFISLIFIPIAIFVDRFSCSAVIKLVLVITLCLVLYGGMLVLTKDELIFVLLKKKNFRIMKEDGNYE